MKRIIKIDVPDDLNAFIESLATFLKTKPDAIIRRTDGGCCESHSEDAERRLNLTKLKKIYKLK